MDSPFGTVIDFIGTIRRAEAKGNTSCTEEAMYYELFSPGKSLES
jgi:hypothetical protein